MTAILLTLLFGADPALACGGFFCSSGGYTTTTTTTQTGDYGLVPVVQDAERILFRENGDGTLTTFVEVGFEQREDVEFAWVIPIPEVIPVEEITTADAGLFNALEQATGPRFTFQWPEVNYNYDYGGINYFYDYDDSGGRGCSACGKAAKGTGTASGFPTSTAGTTLTTTTAQEEIGVVVVEEAVVGPFAIEVITAVDAAEFATWLGDNGYDLPDGAVAPLQHYIDQQMAFLGVKLAPDVPAGPVDTLVFTCPAAQPTIPLILTSIASANDLWITAWTLGAVAYEPANWAQGVDVAPATLPDGAGGTDYLARVEAETRNWDGQAFLLEFAGPTESLEFEDPVAGATIAEHPTLTRWRGRISPWEMTLDPTFAAAPDLEPYANDHLIELAEAPPGARRTTAPDRGPGRGAWLALAPLALGLRRRHR